jgi:hypothetical protein
MKSGGGLSPPPKKIQFQFQFPEALILLVKAVELPAAFIEPTISSNYIICFWKYKVKPPLSIIFTCESNLEVPL